MNVIYNATHNYNYNYNNSSNVKLEIIFKYNNVTQTTYNYTFPNSTNYSIVGIIGLIQSNFLSVTSRNLTIDYTNYENIRFYSTNSLVTFTSVKLYVSSASDSSYYLPLHLGFNDKRATATSNYSAVVSSDFTYCETPFWGNFRFPLNSNSKVVLRPNFVSQVSNWENFEVENESETDVTVAGVFNAYSRSVNFKKVKISNISWFNLFQCDFFKSYCSEILSDSTCTINSTLAQLLFGNSSYTSVYINVSESGFGEVTYEFENLISYYITIIPVEFLETV